VFGTSKKPRGGSRPNWWGAPSSDGGPVRTSAKSLERDIQFQEEMMRKNSKWTGFPTMAMALGLVAWTVSEVKASPKFDYNTSGSIDSTGVSGSPVISFNSITGNSFISPSDFSLGDFLVSPRVDGGLTTYTHTPFHITFSVNTVDDAAPDPNQTPIQVSGELNGTVSGANQSNVKAAFDPIGSPTFQTGSYSNTLSIPDNPLSLVPSTTHGGQTSAQAHLETQPGSTPPASGGGNTTPQGGDQSVPEPTSIALFAAAIGGLALHRYRARRAA
jgi:hypothetical protein